MQTVQPAVVGVMQTASERDHNSDAGQEPFTGLPLPWVRFEFFDEYSVSNFFRLLAEGHFSAVVFASNSLFNPTIYDASRSATAAIRRASSEGMGIIVLQQFLPPGAARDCDFLPLPHGVEYRGTPGGDIESVWVNPRAVGVSSRSVLTLDRSQFGSRSPTLWCKLEPVYAAEWRSIATVSVGGQAINAILRSRIPRARTVVSSLPLDWLADTSLLAYLVARAVRGRGTLYLHPEGEGPADDVALQMALGRSIVHGGHLARHAIGTPQDVAVSEAPYRHFSHYILSPQWSWSDLATLRSDSVKSRLENGGSVTAHAGLFPDGQPMLVTVGGRPPYLEVADRFARWFEVNAESFRDAPTSPVRALAVVAATVESSVADPDAVPRAISVDELRRFLSPYLASRLHGRDQVDGHVLPTAAVASAMELLRFPAEAVAPLRNWIERGHYASSIASLQQAKLWLPGLRIASALIPTNGIDGMYHDLLRARDEGYQSASVRRLCSTLGDGEAPISTRAIIADALTSSSDRHLLSKVASSAQMLQRDLESLLTIAHPPLEAICLITAALIRIHESGGLVSVPPPESVEESTRHSTVDAAMRRNLESVRQELLARDEAMVAARRFARRAVTAGVVIGTLAIAATLALALLTISTDTANWIATLVPAAAGAVAVVTYVGSRAARTGSEPHWLQGLREFFKVGRG